MVTSALETYFSQYLAACYRLSGFLCICLGIALVPTVGLTQGFPTKPVRLVVPYPPGGGTDILARQIAEKISSQPGQVMIVENRPGANGVIATDVVVKSPSDGTVLLFAPTSVIAANPHLYSVSFDVLKDLAPVALLATGQFVLVAHPSVPFDTLPGLIAAAKAAPGKLTFASSGTGSHAHLALEMLKGAAGIDFLHVPYQGGAPALTDLLGGQVQLLFDVVPAVLPHIRSGKLKALAVTRVKRATLLPLVPSIGETIPGFDSGPWYGVFAPARTNPGTIARFNDEFAKATKLPDLHKRLIESGYEVENFSLSEFQQMVRADYDLFGKLIKTLNIKPN
jgi:tripartite-type tricarboxylate transporter receptor subunit TctC